jgi:Carboxypeptidase regulatory-like domain
MEKLEGMVRGTSIRITALLSFRLLGTALSIASRVGSESKGGRASLSHSGKKFWLSTLLALTLAASSLSAATAARAASNLGALRGTLSTFGANHQTYNVPGASLKLTSALSESTPLSAVSDESGEYRFADLNAGLYVLEISADGFKKVARSVTVRPGETTIENVSLEIEELKGVVNVAAESDGGGPEECRAGGRA